ncbi:glycosyltransferase [Dehalobacter sp. TBBPA1]|uniref:MGDG synthase family glycosyltransferase n=1 Tax=Dehalobacter sp. TBBPA1 TaxID=3235037 RepID=UPI0034A4EDCC
MPKVMIFSASTGHGHNQAADCLKKELEASGYSVRIVEPLKKEESWIMEALIDDGYHILATRLPKMYGKLYKITYNEFLNKNVKRILNRAMDSVIEQLIQEYKPDLLITTHPLHVGVVSYLKASGRLNLPFISLVTDYMAHQFYVNSFVDAYIVGSPYTKDTLTEKGVPENKIHIFGIPVREEFRQPRLVRNNDVFTLLIMGGSMGIPYIRKCLKTLMENRHHLRILVVCGSNRKLWTDLAKKYEGTFNDKDVVIYGFTSNIYDLMDQSDVIITKPGGLTASEAINKNIPIIIPFFIPGQEEENTEILVKAGVAVRTSRISELNPLIDSFCLNPGLLEEMRENASDLARQLSPGSIVGLADQLLYESLQVKEYQRAHQS